MAQRVARMYGGSPTLNIYDFDNSVDKLGTLNIRHFDSPSVEWAKFVITNRNATKLKDPQEDSNIDGRFDLVIGPIANDDLALLFNIIHSKNFSNLPFYCHPSCNKAKYA
ncbi:Protein of unknown function [Fibrobacter sp. UWP2]|nr:Protein of unknown function [Fibrobacter sp. UWP2]